MIKAASKFEGTHNFETFRAAACQSNQPVRHVKHCRLFEYGRYLVLDIQADGFYIIWFETLWVAYLKLGKACMKSTILMQCSQPKIVRQQELPPHLMVSIFIQCYYRAV